MASPIARLYRVQLRTARHYDAQPALKTLLALPGTPLIAPAAGARAHLSVLCRTMAQVEAAAACLDLGRSHGFHADGTH